MIRLRWFVGVLGLTFGWVANAGDRLGVLDTLNAMESNWPEANLRAEVRGANPANEVVLGSQIRFGYRSDVPGYLHLVHVSSHGDMTLIREGSQAASAGESGVFKVTEPLGLETVYMLLSTQRLDKLFPDQTNSASLGNSSAAARSFTTQLTTAAQGSRFAIAKADYEVVGGAGQTEHTTRGIERVLEDIGTTAALPPESQGDDASGTGPRVSPNQAAIPSRIGFEFDSDRLTPQGRLDLDVFGEVMIRPQWRSYPVALEGHTDDVGAEAYNFDLSRRRAEAVRSYLVRSFGVDSRRLQVVPYGESRPLKPSADEDDRASNRRVEFVFKKPLQ